MQLTSFPNLCSSDSSCDPPYAAGEIVLHGLDQLSDEAIIAGWGLLLGAYAGVDDVSFLLDDSLVQEPPPLHVPLALTLHCDRSLGRARLAYSSRIPACHAQQMAAQLKRCILAASGSDQTSQAPVSLSVLNPEPKLLDGPRLLHHLIRRDRYHDQLAIDFIDRHGTHQMLSYSALDRLTTVLAQKIHLSLPPTKKQHVVPLLIPQSPELYIAQISILKAGAAFCPLNLDAPPERVKFIINDVSAHLVITTSSIRHKIPQDFPGCVLSLNQQTLEFALDDAADLPSPLPEQLAYVMYTSGSTGTPKGVGVSHLAATQSLLAHDLHIPEFSRFLQFAAPIFDVSVFETFFPFFRGRTLCTCERTDLLSDLPLMMNKLEVDAAELTPTVAGTLLQSRHVVPQLRLLLTIGEMLSPQVVQEFGGNDDKTSILWGMYGPTEAAIHCTLQPSFHSNSKVGNIGRPLDTVSAFILAPSAGPSTDFSLDVVPLGQVGELAVGGHQLARGYLNRPEQTAAAFVQHPKYGRLYRTGDKARLLPDGTLECLGRIMSGQIKLRGQRVELGEVEQAISNISGCRNATASVISGVLVVFVLLSDNILTPETVISESKRWLPAFMVPGDVILLDKLPRLPSGKVDRQTLETNYQNRQTRYEDRQTHIDATEHKICQLVSRVLAQPVLPTSNLTSLGLDSLKAIRVASLLRSSGFKIGAVDFLAADDVASLSSMVQSTYPSTPPAVHEDFFAQVKHATLELPEFVPYLPQVEDVFPCTPVQSAMLAEAAINSEAYCNWVEIEIRQPCNAAEIRRWLHILAEKNQILRTGFANLGHSLSSHSQIVWNGLLESQISEVCDFERGFALSPPSWALRPLQFQVLLSDSGVKVLCRMFHALYDGWSIDLVVNDLNELAAGRPPKDRPQFRDVVVHHTSLTEAQLGRSLDYWRNQLDNYAYSALPNFNGRVVPASSLHVKSRELTTRFDDLRRCAAALKVNPQVMFQAALAYLLSFYLNNTDVTFGTVTSGRTIPVPGIEEILGPCIATLPLRLDVARSHKIKNLLLLVHERNRAMLKHCEIPTRDIKKMCGLAPGSPLYDVLFVWQETLQNNAAPDAIVRQVDGVDKLEFKLTLELEPRSSSVCAKATYDPSILPSPQVDLILGQLEEITSFFIANVEGELTESSKHLSDSLLSMDNVDFDHFEFQAGPPYCVETRAEKTPNALAVEFSHAISESGMKTDRITYRELNTRANQLAHALLALGTTPEDLVCINMEKSIDLYVSILATLKVGAGYVPIIPETPFERVRFILKEAKVKTILAHSSTSAPLVPLERNLINVDQLRFEDHSSKNPNVPYDGSRVGYAVFTSGSTGTPKGVLVTQDNLMSNLEVLARMYPVDDGSRLLQQCSQAFDVSVFEIFFAWYTGMCLCSGTKDELFHDVELAIRQMRVTHLSMTPTVAALVRPENVPDVKFLVTSGEAVTEHVRRIWAGRGLWQGYGPSETTNICTVNPRVSENDLISNIGPAFANTSAFVMDEAKDVLVPKGGVGELCFGGDQVFRGYLNQPELTAKKVINHPKFGRIYRSGDLGRLCPDGSILFTGRSDDQVKLRGQRIELGEINSRILDCPEVKDCVTLLLGKHGKTVQQLASFWVPSYASSKEFGSIAIDEPISKTVCAVFGSLESSVPAYMLPNALIPVSALPRTTQGKTDRRKLTALYEQLTSEYLEAVSRKVEQIDDSNNWSDLEHTVAVVLADVAKLSRQEIGRQVSFFAYGVDSISAISFSTSLKARGLPRVPVSTILKNPTVARLSKVIEATSPVSNIEGAALDLDQVFSSETREQIFAGFARSGVAVSRLLPCSPLQEAMLSSGGLAETTAYLNKMLFKINGDADLMRQCWFDIVKRHDILRTCFVPTEDSQHAFAQVVLRQYEVPWDIIEDEERLIGVQVEHYTEKILPLMDPSKRPPVRFATFNTGDSVHLLFCCHHAIYDGFAMELLVTEVEQVYSGAVLPPAPSFDPYLEQMIIAPSEEADAFWAAHLRAFEPTSFPDLTGLSPSVRKDIVSRKIFAENLPFSCSELEDDCRRLSCSLLALGQAAFAKVISVYTGENDLCFGNVVSGRTLPIDGLERLVAPCFNTLPIRVNFDTVKTNNDLLASLQSFNADILPYQLTPLRRIQANNTQDGSRLFDTLFILQQSAYQLNGDIWELKEDFGEMDFSLVCELVPNRKKDALALILRYDEAFIPKSDIFCVAKTFASAFKSCLHDPSALSSDVGVPNELLSLSNLEFETLETSAGPFLHSGLEINAACRPDAVALEFQHSDGNRGMWTFNELNQISNQIAHALLMHEVSLEDAVPICITKSPSYYASVLAVLKAGAAFTPIDDSLPASRKDFMLKELGAKVLIASRPVDTSWVTETKIIFFEDLRELPTNNPLIPGLKPNHLAYRLYTSGSTGTPKAVSVEHRNPVQTVEASRSIIPWTNETRLLQFAAITFDMCYYDCFLAWTFGFTLCAAEQPAMLNDIVDTILSLEITLVDLTPSVAMSIKPDAIPSLQYMYCIGEAMPQELVDRWEGKLVNSYGPTEAAFCVSIFKVSKGVKSAVIGKPFPTTSFSVRSRDGLSTVPLLGVGELYLGGPQVAREYHANPEKTKASFVIDDGRRFYQTGDLVRMLGNGTFEFVGRVDDQVKIRGLRVELSEISHVVEQAHPALMGVHTQVIRASEQSKEQLVAFLAVGKEPEAQNEHDLILKVRDMAKTKLPAYMVPKFFVPVDKIPLSAAGKVDRKALKTTFHEWQVANQNSVQEDEREWTVDELEVRAVFAKLSNAPVSSISLQTTIYQLGLDSISAVQVAAILRKKGFKATAVDVLERPTCEDLGSVLQLGQTNGDISEPKFNFEAFDEMHCSSICQELNIPGDQVISVKPCTPLQSGMVSKFLQSKGRMYFNYMEYYLPGVDAATLEQAWHVLLKKHEILRSGFVHINDSHHPFGMLIWHFTAADLPVTKFETSEHQRVVDWRKESLCQVLDTLHKGAFRVLLADRSDGVSMHLSMLHSLYDAQSLRTLLDDLANIIAGADPSLSPVEPGLSAILGLSADDSNQRKQFWEQKSKDIFVNPFPKMTPLKVREGETKVLSRISAQKLSLLESGCRHAGVSMQAAGQSAWARLLCAYTGEEAATFGVVFSGRTQDDTKAVAFPCITTVPLPARNHATNRAVLDDMMAFNSAVRKHQFTPLTKIQRWTGHPDEVLFDTIFAYQKLDDANAVSRKWRLVNEEATVDVAISIELEPNNLDQLELRIWFNTDRLPLEQAQSLLEQLDTILVDLINRPDADMDAAFERVPHLLSITPPKEREIQTDVELLHEFVEKSARRIPDKIAFEFATNIEDGKVTSKCWTYSQLDAEGNQIANLLISRGVQPGGLVGVCFDKCPEASIGILGILKAGCAFVALDPGAPVARKAFITEDSNAQLVLSMSHQSNDFKEQVKVPLINLDVEDYSKYTTERPQLSRNITPQDLSYCLYTSGTTGTPKGCELTHENAVQAMMAFSRLFYPRWDTNSRWLQFASFHFDVSVLEQYWSWAEGIRLTSAPRDLIFEDLAGAINALQITHIDLTPSLAKILSPEDVPSLTRGVFITGGEALKQEILDAWGKHEVIHNGYGPTEATIGVTMFPRVPENGKPSNIGPQFDNVGSFVFKPKTNVPVIRGGVGELCVSGKLVGKGYLHCPQLTDERFPYLPEFDERVYRTGDLVRILHDGSFDFLGRADDQVKLRGQRLEIGEINSVINQNEAQVLDSATLVLKHPKQQKDQLISFVVTKSTYRKKQKPTVVFSAKEDMQCAQDACRSKLPTYMVPTYFIPLTSMPLSPNNKADGKQLKEIYSTLSAEQLQAISISSEDGGAASSAEEKKIFQVLTTMASVSSDNISRSSSIFELGLDSISVIGFANALRKAGFENAQASSIMKNSVISRLAKVLSSTRVNNSEQSAILAAKQAISACQHQYKPFAASSLSIDQADIEDIAPCSPLQQGIISRVLESEKPVYFASFKFELATDTDLAKLKASWQTVYESVQILRARFVPTDDGYIQAVLRDTSLPWVESESEFSSEERLESFLSQRKHKWWSQNRDKIRRPFELVAAAAPAKTLLSINIMHTLYDGVSLPILLQIVQAVYYGKEAIDFGPRFLDVLPYGPLRSIPESQDFWKSHLAGAQSPLMPSLISKPQDEDVAVKLRLDDISAFETVRRRLDVTHQALAQASWAAVLQKHFAGSVTFGMIVSGRSIDFEGAERTIGPLFNTIPFHMRIGPDDNWVNVVRKCHDFNTSCMPHQHTPLRDIVKWAKRPTNQPLFDTLFVFQHEMETAEPCAELWKLLDDQPEADYPLALEVEHKIDGSLGLTIVAQGHVMDEESARGLLKEFENALRDLLRNEGALVSATVDVIESSGSQNQNVPGENGVNGSTNGVDGFEWTPVARKIQEQVATLAGMDVQEVDEQATIFEFGLDSIDAIKLSSRLKKMDVNLPVSHIMRSLTIPKMAREVQDVATDSSDMTSGITLATEEEKLRNYFLSSNRLDMEKVDRILPVTPLQEAMVTEMVSSGFRHYFNHDVLKLDPEVDLEKMNQAWNSVYRKSTILRTAFEEIDDPDFDISFAQIVYKPRNLTFQEVDIVDEKDIGHVLENIRERTAQNDGREGLLQLTIVSSLSAKYLILSVAHALYDGWSLGLLHNDVQSAYEGKSILRPSYDRILESILNASGKRAARFWRDFLEGALSSAIPHVARVQGQISDLKVHRLERKCSISINKLRVFCKKTGITLQALGQTAWSLVLAAYLGKLDLVFGVVLSGRDTQEAEDVMFPTMNTVAVRSIVHGTRKDMLRYMQENIGNIRQFQHFPLRKAKAMTNTHGKPLFDSLFMFQARPDEDGVSDSGALYKSIGGASDVEYPVAVEMEAIGDALVWRTACKSDVFDSAGTEELLKRVDAVIQGILNAPDEAAVVFGEEGVCVCGLPPFKHAPTDNGSKQDEPHTNGVHNPKEWSSLEQTICKVLSMVSKIPENEITRDATIFHLGLDSISAIKVSALLRKTSIKISVSEMLRAGTVANMAKAIEATQPSAILLAAPAAKIFAEYFKGLDVEKLLTEASILSGDVEQVMSASAGQVYMLSVWQQTEGQTLYPGFRYRISGVVHKDVLRDAWIATVAANPILRTAFLATGDQELPFIQVILNSPEDSFHLVDESASIKARSEQPFVALFAQKQGECWILTIKIHHALYDGVSLPVIVQQFETHCNKAAPNPNSPTVFPSLLAHGVARDTIAKRKSFWTSYLASLAPERLPRPQSTNSGRTSVFRTNIAPSLLTIERIAPKHGLNIQTLFLAAYARIYARLTNFASTSDVIIGIWLANRALSIDGLVDAAIPTVNLVPLRVPAPLKTPLFDTAKRIQADLAGIGTAENSSVALSEIHHWTGIQADTFVNFLKLPEGEDSSTVAGATEGGAGQDNSIRVHEFELPDHPAEGWSHVEKYEGSEWQDVPELANNAVKNSYLHSIDVEAVVRGGDLHMGVYCDAGMLDVAGAKRIIDEMAEELRRVS